jgi:hypothetical protein
MIIFGNFLAPFFFIGIARLITLNYSMKKEVWFSLILIVLLVDVWMLVEMIILRNAGKYFFSRSVIDLGMSAAMIYGTFIVLETEMVKNFQQILMLLMILVIFEWLISYSFQKIRLRKVLDKRIPNNAIDDESKSLDLQKQFLYSKNDADESRTVRILAIGRILLCFAPATGAVIYRILSSSQQSIYSVIVLSTFSILFTFISGIQAGIAIVIKETENKVGKKIVIKKLE